MRRSTGPEDVGGPADGEWLSIHEASELVGVSSATLRRWCDAGRVEAFTTPGGHRRFARSAMLRFLPERNTDASMILGPAEATEAIVRASRQRLASRPWSAWIRCLPACERERLGAESRVMVRALVEHVAALPVDPGAARLRPALCSATVCGRTAALNGLRIGEMVDLFLALRTTIIERLGAHARRHALTADATTLVLERAASATDRLLSAAIEGHQAAGGHAEFGGDEACAVAGAQSELSGPRFDGKALGADNATGH